MSEITQGTTNAPATPAFGQAQNNGWMVFAGAMISISGAFNAIDGLVGLYRTRYFSNTYLIGNLRDWSWVFLAFGALQIAAGLSILARQGWARWFGIVMVSINAFLQLFVIGTYPLYASLIIAYDIVVFYALTVHWQRRITAA